VLELEDLEDGALDLDVVAVLELIGRNYRKSAPEPSRARRTRSLSGLVDDNGRTSPTAHKR
jgi:hypothetical protein